MCGIIGYSPITPTDEAFDAFGRLFDESRVRGLHAFGLVYIGLSGSLSIVRSYTWTDITESFNPLRPTIAHARYCQSGDWKVMENNQPIVVGSMALAHNGVIHMGTKAEFEAAFNVQCTVDNDSEIFLRRLEQGQDAAEFIASITGSFAATWLKDGRLYAGRNARRPLWRCDAYGARWYASTKDIFRRARFTRAWEIVPGVEG